MGECIESDKGTTISNTAWKDTLEECLSAFNKLKLNRLELKLPFGQLLKPLTTNDAALPVRPIQEDEALRLFEQMKLVIFYDPGIRRSILLEQKLHCEVVPGSKVLPKPGFFYKIKPKKGIIIKKVIATERSNILDKILNAHITECNRVFLMYCNPIPGK